MLGDPNNAVYPTSLQAAGTNPCYVGWIRQDPWENNTDRDVLRHRQPPKGAALKPVHIDELLVAG